MACLSYFPAVSEVLLPCQPANHFYRKANMVSFFLRNISPFPAVNEVQWPADNLPILSVWTEVWFHSASYMQESDKPFIAVISCVVPCPPPSSSSCQPALSFCWKGNMVSHCLLYMCVYTQEHVLVARYTMALKYKLYMHNIVNVESIPIVLQLENFQENENKVSKFQELHLSVCLCLFIGKSHVNII